jgi:hypothetical protein
LKQVDVRQDGEILVIGGIDFRRFLDVGFSLVEFSQQGMGVAAITVGAGIVRIPGDRIVQAVSLVGADSARSKHFCRMRRRISRAAASVKVIAIN